MSDYIKREDVINIVCDACNDKFPEEPCEPPDCAIFNVMKEYPAADVVEVVRCKDCKWCHSGYCEKYDDLIPFGCANRPWEEWFCADGASMRGES